jgi:hypothetical protein
MLANFHGHLYAAGRGRRPILQKDVRLAALQRMASSGDMFTQTASVSALALVSEMTAQRVPAVIPQDLQLVLLWSLAPSPAVAQRILLVVALLAQSPANRERIALVPNAVKTIVAGARAASKLKQLHAARPAPAPAPARLPPARSPERCARPMQVLAMGAVAKSRALASQLVALGGLQVPALRPAPPRPASAPRQH